MTKIRAPQDPPERLDLEGAISVVQARVDRALTGSPPLLRPYTSHLASAHGKLLRAAALLTCAQDEGGAVPPDAVPFAAGIELLHLATLVHDDVIDDADTRRGIPTIQRKWGRKTAVICGDYLLSAALRMAASVSDRGRYLDLDLPDYMARVCAGELLQQQNSGNLDLTVTGYLRVIRGKTAALFEGAYRAGAILCAQDPSTVSAYARLGRYVGMVFQLIDDCIDYDSDGETAKKPVQSDYEQGVITLPLIHTLGQEPGLKAQRLAPGEAARWVRKSGGTDYTRAFARRYCRKAQATLDGLALPPWKRAQLLAILDRAYGGPRPAIAINT